MRRSLYAVLWAATCGLFLEVAWWLLVRTPEFTRCRPSQAYYNRDDYWGDL